MNAHLIYYDGYPNGLETTLEAAELEDDLQYWTWGEHNPLRRNQQDTIILVGVEDSLIGILLANFPHILLSEIRLEVAPTS